MVEGVEMPVEFRPDRSSPGHPLGRGADAWAADDPPARRAAGTAGVAQGAWAARISGACPARCCSGASFASCCGTSPTIRAENFVGASARSGAWSTSPIGAGSTPRRTPSDLIWRTASSMRSRSPGRSRTSTTIGLERLQSLATLFAGDFLEGLEIDRSPAFNGWVTAQRRQFRGYHAALLEHLVKNASEDEVLGYLEKWLVLAPFDERVHELLLNALARRGQIREGNEHLAATIRLFEAEGLDCGPIRDAWRSARAQADSPPSVRPAVPDATAATRQSS